MRLIVVLALIGSAYYLSNKLKSRPKKKKHQLTPNPVVPKEDPLVWLKAQLAQLKQRLGEDPSNEFLVDVWGQIIRGYIFRLNSLPALASTTRELKRLCSNNSGVLKLIPCLESSDRFKFQTESRRQIQIKGMIEHFIRETENHLILCGN